MTGQERKGKERKDNDRKGNKGKERTKAQTQDIFWGYRSFLIPVL